MKRQSLRALCALGAFVGAGLGVVQREPGGWSIDIARRAHAGCAFMKAPGQFCHDVTEHCTPGCAATSCAERVRTLTTLGQPLQTATYFDGAVARCSHAGNRMQIFECAWGLAARAFPDVASDQCTKNGLWAVFDSIAFNHALQPMPATETCDLPRDGSVPSGYVVLSAPRRFLEGGDAPQAAGSQFNIPPAHNIGTQEGRLNATLRRVARMADPMACSLPLAAKQFAIARSEQDLELARAFADLSVTGHRAWFGGPASPPGTRPVRPASQGFRREAPDLAYCRALPDRLRHAQAAPADPNFACPTIDGNPVDDALIAGCQQALRRAYQTANFLRAGYPRGELGWIAVSGEDDSPHRPVNVPRSPFPQYDVEVDVPAPLAQPPNARTVHVRSRFTVAQLRAGALDVRPGRLNDFAFAPEPALAIAPDAEILLFVHGMGSRAEEADDITLELFRQLRGSHSTRNLTVIAVDLPTSGYADNLDYEKVSPLTAIGNAPGLDFHATGQTPVLDFIENFVVGFAEELDRRSPGVKARIKAVVGGSLGGSMTFRLGRRPGVPWLPRFIVWSPASIWDSLAAGADLTKHIGPHSAWISAGDARDPGDPFALDPRNAGRRASFFIGWDKPIVPVLIPMAQSDTWQSDHYPCKKSCVASARLDRQETYDAQFQAWHWRLAAEQLIYSHQAIDPVTHDPRYLSNTKRMLLVCGVEDNITYNDICGATQRTAPHMTTTPGRALFLELTGHSVDNERREFFAQQILAFLAENAPPGPLPVTTPLAALPANPKKALGELCLQPTECESNRCSGFPLKCEAQPLGGKKSNGQPCALPSDCQSNRCIITCQAQPEKKPNGLACLLPADCLSNRCSGFPLKCEAQPPPATKKPNGQGCLMPSECESNRCSGFPLKCEAQPPPATKKPNGQGCLMPSECESNRCSGFPLRCEPQPR